MTMKISAMVAAMLSIVSCQSSDKGSKSSDHGRYRVPPGADPFEPALAGRMREAVIAFGPDYQPRTKHKIGDKAKYVNRLIFESSPYLRQHAHNPVNWYPWGEEAFAAAKRTGRPVLLSVGYSTCHWCHVMEEESFEDEEIAKYLNENYVAIKVDRERRPDIDAIYMRAIRLLTKNGGWPMTVWLTPDRKPFFGGTYFPPRATKGRGLGFLEVLGRAKKAFDENPDDIADTADKLTRQIQAMGMTSAGGDLPTDAVLGSAIERYRRGFDHRYGGLRSRRNKFPSSLPIRVLLRYFRRTKDQTVLDMAVLTLDRMRAGGMYDQAGGGFHRYSTDPAWLVPHFEKMLYDNARLAVVYLEAYQAAGAQRFADTARDILDYIEREMGDPGGGFYSATDADSLNSTGEREEGAFFVWTRAELDEALDDDAELAAHYFGVVAGGNFEGKSILNTPRPLSEVAHSLGLSDAGARAKIASIRERLRVVRARRSAPGLDDKILAGWNGLTISAFARAARALSADRDRYLAVAKRAADFVVTNMRKEGRLRRSYASGRAELEAYLEDYAFVIAGLIDLFEACSEVRYLELAIELDGVLAKHYEDERGGFFRTADDSEKLLVREKPLEDGAIPSGNSVQALNLLRLYELTTQDSYLARAERLLRVFGDRLSRSPGSADELLLALDFFGATRREVVIVAPGAERGPLDDVVSTTFVPNHVFVRAITGQGVDTLARRVPFVESKIAIEDKATAYVCERQQCELPTSDPKVLAKQLAKVTPMTRSSDSERKPSSDRPPSR